MKGLIGNYKGTALLDNDLALTYTDGNTRNLKIYRLADGWYFNEFRLQKIKEHK